MRGRIPGGHRLTRILLGLGATAVVHGPHQPLGGLVAQRRQVDRIVVAQRADLLGRHQREDVLHGGAVVRPELLPECVIAGIDELRAAHNIR